MTIFYYFYSDQKICNYVLLSKLLCMYDMECTCKILNVNKHLKLKEANKPLN